MADNRINEASWDLVNSLQETNQAVANSVVATQDHYLKFTQNLFLSGTEVLEKQIEKGGATVARRARHRPARARRRRWSRLRG